MATMLEEENDQTLEKDLSAGVGAKVEQPELIPRMQAYVLYLPLILYFEPEVNFADTDRLVVGIIQLLHKCGGFHHPSLHEESTVGTVARMTQESWRMFVHPIIKLHTVTEITQDYRYCVHFRCLRVDLAQTTPHVAIP